MAISNLPPKGTSDWYFEEFKIRQYIFEVWRKVSLRFGYEEYLTPIIEKAELYKAKSGEDIGGKELMIFVDNKGRELSIRPEMTPSVTRMVTRIYNDYQKPLKLFSIANFVRNERPQRGRNREFWQLNYDVFGSNSIASDIEIVQMAIEIMLEFEPPAGSFVIYINNRKLIQQFLDEILDLKKTEEKTKQEIVRILDKWNKLEEVQIFERLQKLNFDQNSFEKLSQNIKIYINSKNLADLIKNFPQLKASKGVKEIDETINRLTEIGLGEWLEFKPSMIRGFDYYDGLIFECFDKFKDNNRSMFGGGRYNGLSEIFGANDIPATGCAPGDETIRLFLESWDLTGKILKNNQNLIYYFPLISSSLKDKAFELAQKLKNQGLNIRLGFEEKKLGKALEFANKSGFKKVIIFGENEAKENIYLVKDLANGKQKKVATCGDLGV
jgi:histidyl-tRNA synthetase